MVPRLTFLFVCVNQEKSFFKESRSINPEDLHAVESKKPEIMDSMSSLENIVFKTDSTIERGGCKLESTCCTVDASMTSQIKVINDAIMASENVSDFQETRESQ